MERERMVSDEEFLEVYDLFRQVQDEIRRVLYEFEKVKCNRGLYGR